MPNTLMRALFGLTLLLTALPATPLFASDYALDTGDKVRIAVHDWPDLSGNSTSPRPERSSCRWSVKFRSRASPLRRLRPRSQQSYSGGRS